MKKFLKKSGFSLDIETIIKIILILIFLVIILLVLYSSLKDNFIINWLKHL